MDMSAPEGTADGQADSGLQTELSGTTDTAPVEDPTGQAMPQSDGATAPGATGDPAPGQADTDAEADTFYSKSDLDGVDPDNVQEVLKRYQAAYTKKTQAIAQQRQKIEAYDAFSQNPVEGASRLLSQYGYRVVPPGQAVPQGQPGQQGTGAADGIGEDWAPQNWQEVLTKAAEIGQQKAEQSIMQKLAPVFQNVQQMSAQTIESEFDKLDPNWRVYEDDMADLMKAHPSLVKDPAKLYKLAVPSEVYESRAMQKALKKLEGKTRSAAVAGGSTARGGPAAKPIKSFDDAVNEARRQIQGK